MKRLNKYLHDNSPNIHSTILYYYGSIYTSDRKVRMVNNVELCGYYRLVYIKSKEIL